MLREEQGRIAAKTTSQVRKPLADAGRTTSTEETRSPSLEEHDPSRLLVAGWMSEVQGERLRAEQELGEAIPGDEMTAEQIRALVLKLKDIASVLRKADPKLKAEVYKELGVGSPTTLISMLSRSRLGCVR